MGSDLEVTDIDDESLGPAMKRCTSLQRRFVLAVLMVGGGQHQRAAQMAGYSGNANGLAQAGWRTAHTPYVQQAILEEAAKRLGGSAIEAVNTVLETMSDPKASRRERTAAAAMILDRVGLHSKTEHSVTVTQDVGKNTVMLEMIRAQIKRNPDFINNVPEPIRRLLAPAVNVKVDEPVDVVYTEIDKADPGVLDPELEEMLK